MATGDRQVFAQSMTASVSWPPNHDTYPGWEDSYRSISTTFSYPALDPREKEEQPSKLGIDTSKQVCEYCKITNLIPKNPEVVMALKCGACGAPL
jgi:hypothetical protein